MGKNDKGRREAGGDAGGDAGRGPCGRHPCRPSHAAHPMPPMVVWKVTGCRFPAGKHVVGRYAGVAELAEQGGDVAAVVRPAVDNVPHDVARAENPSGRVKVRSVRTASVIRSVQKLRISPRRWHQPTTYQRFFQ